MIHFALQIQKFIVEKHDLMEIIENNSFLGKMTHDGGDIIREHFRGKSLNLCSATAT